MFSKMQVVSLRKATCTKGIRLPSFVACAYPEKKDTILALFQQRKEYGCASKGILLVSLFCSNNKRDTDAETKGYFLYPFFVLTTKGIQMRKQRDTSCIPSLF